MPSIHHLLALSRRQDSSSPGTSPDTSTTPAPIRPSTHTIGIIIASVLGSLLFLLLIWVGVVVWRRIRRRQAEEEERKAERLREERDVLGVGWGGEKGMGAGWKAYTYGPKDRKDEKEREKRRSMYAGWHVSPSSGSVSNEGRQSYLDIMGTGTGLGSGSRRVDAGSTNPGSTALGGTNVEASRFGGVWYAGKDRDAETDSIAGMGMGMSFTPLSSVNLGAGVEKKPSRPSLRIYIPGSTTNHSSTSLASKASKDKDKDNSVLNSNLAASLKQTHLLNTSQSHLDLPSSHTQSQIQTPHSFLPLGASSNSLSASHLNAGAKRVSATVVRLSNMGFGLGFSSSSGGGYGGGGNNGNGNGGHIVSAGASSAFTMSTMTTLTSNVTNGGLGVRAIPPGLGVPSRTNLSSSYSLGTSGGGGVTKHSKVFSINESKNPNSNSKPKLTSSSNSRAAPKNSKPKSSWKPFHLNLSSKSKQFQSQLQSQSQSQISLPLRDKPSHPFLHTDPSTTNPSDVNTNSDANSVEPSSAYPSSILDIRKRPVSGATMTTRVTVGTIGTLGTVGTRASTYGYGYGGYSGGGEEGEGSGGGGMLDGLPPVPPVPTLPPPVPTDVQLVREKEVPLGLPQSVSPLPVAHMLDSSPSHPQSHPRSTRNPQPLPTPPTSHSHVHPHSNSHSRRLTGPRRLPSLKSRSQGVRVKNAREELVDMQTEVQVKEKGKKAIHAAGLGVEDRARARDDGQEHDQELRRSFTPFSSDEPPPYRTHRF